jgi:hypothetical protein
MAGAADAAHRATAGALCGGLHRAGRLSVAAAADAATGAATGGRTGDHEHRRRHHDHACRTRCRSARSDRPRRHLPRPYRSARRGDALGGRAVEHRRRRDAAAAVGRTVVAAARASSCAAAGARRLAIAMARALRTHAARRSHPPADQRRRRWPVHCRHLPSGGDRAGRAAGADARGTAGGAARARTGAHPPSRLPREPSTTPRCGGCRTGSGSNAN